jgi:predicted phosphate transport protein (TIGR00153 family)
MAVGHTFSNLFGRSPITPLQTHMTKVQSCAETLIPFFKAVRNEDWEAAANQQELIRSLENEADALKKELRLQLPKSLFLPVSRTDLLDLLSMQDKIANRAKDIAGIMLGRKMTLPEQLSDPVNGFVAEAVSASAQALKAIQELDELLETSFGGRETRLVESLIQELDAIENRTDELEVEIRAKLFAIEKDLQPVDVMFLYRIIDWIGDLADRAQKVGSRLQILIAR